MRELTDVKLLWVSLVNESPFGSFEIVDETDAFVDPDLWVVCPSCDEIVPRAESNEHVCPIEGLDDR